VRRSVDPSRSDKGDGDNLTRSTDTTDGPYFYCLFATTNRSVWLARGIGWVVGCTGLSCPYWRRL